MEHQLRLPGDWPVGVHHAVSKPLTGEDLESVLVWLQEAEVNAWIQTTPPAHIAVGVRDPYGGDDIGKISSRSMGSGRAARSPDG